MKALHLRAQPIDAMGDGALLRQFSTTRIGKRFPARLAIEERNAELRFHIGNGVADYRRCPLELASGARETAHVDPGQNTRN